MSIAALVAFATAMGACTTSLDMKKVEASIKTGLAEKLELPIASAACPATRDGKAGDVFECTATAETGGVLKVKVTQTDATGNISWELTNGDSMLSLTALGKLIKDKLKEDVQEDFEVDCGGKMRVSVPDKTFECKAKSATATRDVLVTMKDDKGNINWELK
jgi:hypothetical protein